MCGTGEGRKPFLMDGESEADATAMGDDAETGEPDAAGTSDDSDAGNPDFPGPQTRYRSIAKINTQLQRTPSTNPETGWLQ